MNPCNLSAAPDGTSHNMRPEPYLRLDAQGLTLCARGMELRQDFACLLPRIAPHKLAHEMLIKAARIKGTQSWQVFDATAGLGEDAFLLAAAGAEVWLCERDVIIAELLMDALQRAQQDERLASICARMHLIQGDSVEQMSQAEGAARHVSVIYLDPMFPTRTKSAAVKKKFQLLHELEPPALDEERLLEAALAAQPSKIVIKRPLKAEYLGGRRASYSIRGKAVRFDVLAL
ncbi:class I SAM-dependent methyltransferase [Collinsella sp. zg1085]|nr:class I SAM-dependent methyltransferase [Collinsella sp. zg1085]